MQNKNHFRQHIPSFCDGAKRLEIPFDSQDELFQHEFFDRYSKESNFCGFYLSHDSLMATFDNQTKWWVLGYILRPAELDLPPWIAVRTANGQCYPESAKLILDNAIDEMKEWQVWIERNFAKLPDNFNERFGFYLDRLRVSYNSLCSRYEHENDRTIK